MVEKGEKPWRKAIKYDLELYKRTEYRWFMCCFLELT